MQEHIFDATDGDFQLSVLERSQKTPVLVDFWAPWCGPCRMLGPALEEVVLSMDGKVLLAKLNVDESPSAASRYRVSSIPAVKLFHQGEVLDEFVGALPASRIREFLKNSLPSNESGMEEEIRKAIAKKDFSRAESLLSFARGQSVDSPVLLLIEADLRLAQGDFAKARDALSHVEQEGRYGPERRALESRLYFVEACATWKKSDDALNKRMHQGNCHAAEGRYQEAMEAFLDVLAENRSFGEGAARQAMLQVFEAIGPRTPLVDEYRDRLSRLLH